MRIATQSNEVVTSSTNISKPNGIANDMKSTVSVQLSKENMPLSAEDEEISREKLQQAVNTINEFLQINQTSSKFVLHDGLGSYFVQVVDSQTEEVVKEIPPKKLLDAFYEMQKLLGMVVDEKI